MANLKEIRIRIASVSSTMKVTNAMKMVSAAKLKKAQNAITSMRPYANKLTELLQNLSATLEGDDQGSIFTEQREVEKVLIVAISSNRGLAGAFNSNIVKACKKLVSESYKAKHIDYYTLGKKAGDILKKEHSILETNTAIFEDLTFENNAEIAQKLMDLFTEGTHDKIVLVYNKFKNAATQIVTIEQFLPIESSNGKETIIPDYIFEPSKTKIVKELIPKSLKTQLFKVLRESVASEHGARMTAMHKATDNATELRDTLLLKYNKARQAAITSEILEIVGGAEALAG
ncbi:MAG: ATP synthase F1 subunit gamma [Bacteroidetes bacterium]|nr:ATP synthase F1 subunit gamma [Bacteroidota bacterium]